MAKKERMDQIPIVCILVRKLNHVLRSLDLNPAVSRDYHAAIKEINECLYRSGTLSHEEFGTRLQEIEKKLSLLDTPDKLLASLSGESISDYLQYHLDMELSDEQKEKLDY